MLLRARIRTRSHSTVSPRPGPPPPPSRRPALVAAISIAALLAVGGAACSSASAPPSATPWTALVGPSGTIPTPQMEALRTVAERVPVAPSTSSPSAADEPAAPTASVEPVERVAPAADARSITAAPVDPAVRLGGTWACSYFAVGSASGSTLEVRIDDAAGRITPEPGRVVAMSCLEGDDLRYQELFVFDPARPFGSLDELLGGADE